MNDSNLPKRCVNCGNEIHPDYPWLTCPDCDKNTRSPRAAGDQPADDLSPVIVTGPNDPPVIRVQIADPDDINDEPITVRLVAEFNDRPSIELSFDKYRAQHIAELLIAAAHLLDERLADADAFEQITREAP